MSSKLSTFSKRVEKISDIVDPRPQVIDITGVRDALIAELADSMSEEERNTPCELTAQEEADMAALDAFLEEDVQRIERDHNIKLVSHD